jgi:hypothetical protein
MRPPSAIIMSCMGFVSYPSSIEKRGSRTIDQVKVVFGCRLRVSFASGSEVAISEKRIVGASYERLLSSLQFFFVSILLCPNF